MLAETVEPLAWVRREALFQAIEACGNGLETAGARPVKMNRALSQELLFV